MWSLYILICPIDNTVRYVGISENPIERFRDHMKNRENPHKFNWINLLKKQNKKPEMKIIRENMNEQQACEAEKMLISVYRAILGNKLTNIHEGGNIPPTHFGEKNPSKRSEVKRKISEKRKGFKHTQEAKEKISKIHKGKKLSVQHIDAIKKANSNKKLTKAAKEKLSLDMKNRFELGFSTLGQKNGKSKKVIQMTFEGTVIGEFDSVLIAARELNIDNSLICKVCRGERKQAGGFKWQFKKEFV